MKKDLHFVLFILLLILLTACSGGSGDTTPTPVNKVAFTTSIEGTAKFGDWPGAGGASGLAAANNICQARATAAGLSGTYRAWVSDSTTDAYCNVLGLTGKKDNNCGQGATLPVNAGPWVRTDGARFAPTINILTSSPWIVYTPLNYDEFGNLIPGDWNANFTNTNMFGVMRDNFNACSDWNDDSSDYNAVGGVAPFTDHRWASEFVMRCDSNCRLVCMQTGAGIPLPAPTTTGKKVFVTSETGNGNLASWTSYSSGTGAAAGDSICQKRAYDAGLANYANFKAWLSVSGTDAINRLTSNGPWVRLDGIMVANDKTDLVNGLISGLLFTSIMQNEFGVYWSGKAWTGTDSNGLLNTEYGNCNNWADGTDSYKGKLGATYSSAFWTADSDDDCSASSSPGSGYAIYCFED